MERAEPWCVLSANALVILTFPYCSTLSVQNVMRLYEMKGFFEFQCSSKPAFSTCGRYLLEVKLLQLPDGYPALWP
jgi:hypothetical protein